MRAANAPLIGADVSRLTAPETLSAPLAPVRLPASNVSDLIGEPDEAGGVAVGVLCGVAVGAMVGVLVGVALTVVGEGIAGAGELAT